MAIPYAETTESLTDFSQYHDFGIGFLDSSHYDQVLGLSLEGPFYNTNHVHSSFETPSSPVHSTQSNQFQTSLHLQDPTGITAHLGSSGGGLLKCDDVSNWLQPRTSTGNMNSFNFTSLGSNSGLGLSSWDFEKINQTRDSLSNQHNFNTGLNVNVNSHPELEKSLSVTCRNPISPTDSVVTLGDFPSPFRQQSDQTPPTHDEIKRGSTSHSDNSLSATEGDIQRGHRRRMSGVEEGQLPSLTQSRHTSFLRNHNEELPNPEDVSSMLMDLESKLVASLNKSSEPQQIPTKQQLDGGMVHHTHTGSWEDSLTSESTLVSPSPSRRGDHAHNILQFGESASPPLMAQTSAGLLQTQGYSNQQEPGIRLVDLLIGCADAVANKNESHAKLLLSELSHLVSPYGDTMQRVASYFTYGLVAHIAGTGSGSNLYRALRIKEPTAADTLDAFQVFSNICPFMKFGQVSATQAILEAFHGEQDVHWIDLGMVQGSQWLSYQLLQGLANRKEGPPKMIHLTGVQVKVSPRSPESLTSSDDQTGRQLKEFADSLNLNFIFQPVSIERLEHLQPWMLTPRNGQAIAINCSAKMHTLLYDDGNCLNYVLSILHNLRPKIFSLLEQEASHNGPVFLARFLEALHFYSAMFDSLDATLTRTSPERAKVEQLWLGQEIINIIACEGQDRVERHERSQQWRSRMAKAGYRPSVLSEATVAQVKSLHSISYGTGFTVLEDRGSLILTWQDRPLFSSSIWTC